MPAGRGLLTVYDQEAVDLVLDRLLVQEASVSQEADSIFGLDLAFLALKEATGVQLQKAGQAVVLLKLLGLPEFARRFSRLTVRRRGAARPDVVFVLRAGVVQCLGLSRLR